jgi:hypothetical protein
MSTFILLDVSGFDKGIIKVFNYPHSDCSYMFDTREEADDFGASAFKDNYQVVEIE